MLDMVEDDNGNFIGEVKWFKIKYFDMILIVISLCIFKSGFFFVVSEFGNYFLY